MMPSANTATAASIDLGPGERDSAEWLLSMLNAMTLAVNSPTIEADLAKILRAKTFLTDLLAPASLETILAPAPAWPVSETPGPSAGGALEVPTV